jgi:hypothetical protein
MMVAILVICYVLVLRYLDQKNRERDKLKSGAAVAAGPADYSTIARSLSDLSSRITAVESQYEELAQRVGVNQ